MEVGNRSITGYQNSAPDHGTDLAYPGMDLIDLDSRTFTHSLKMIPHPNPSASTRFLIVSLPVRISGKAIESSNLIVTENLQTLWLCAIRFFHGYQKVYVVIPTH